MHYWAGYFSPNREAPPAARPPPRLLRPRTAATPIVIRPPPSWSAPSSAPVSRPVDAISTVIASPCASPLPPRWGCSPAPDLPVQVGTPPPRPPRPGVPYLLRWRRGPLLRRRRRLVCRPWWSRRALASPSPPGCWWTTTLRWCAPGAWIPLADPALGGPRCGSPSQGQFLLDSGCSHFPLLCVGRPVSGHLRAHRRLLHRCCLL